MSLPVLVRFTSLMSAIRLDQFQHNHISVTARVTDGRKIEVASNARACVIRNATEVTVIVISVAVLTETDSQHIAGCVELDLDGHPRTLPPNLIDCPSVA